VTINEDSDAQHNKHTDAEAESLRLLQEREQLQAAEASFIETYSAIIKLFKVKQKKYQNTLDRKISLKAIAIFGILLFITSVIATILWCLINVAIVLATMHLFSSVWLGLGIAVAINILLILLALKLMRKVKREIGFNRTQRVFKGDS
jgi:hypothetical protein